MSVILAGTVRFAPDKLAAAKPRMLEMMRLSRAEDGCIDYAYTEDLLDPGLIHVFEIWRDQAALDAHHDAPHFIEWKASRADLGMSDRRMFGHDVFFTREA